MKKIDLLIFRAFFGPFLLTLTTVIFIFELQFIVNYFESLVGKGLSIWVFAELFFYLSINITTTALPLAVLLASLITFGNLGEHYELTAVKASGISLIRVLMPLWIFTLVLTAADVWFYDTVVPKANLNFYSMLWDIKQKKATLSLKEGSFYNDLPNYSIKVNKKYPDGKTLKEVMIYDHHQNQGNTRLIMADSGKMYMVFNERYLVLELFNGSTYDQQLDPQKPTNDQYLRNRFKQNKMVFSLDAFNLGNTPEELFSNSKYMKNMVQLDQFSDSMRNETHRLTEQIRQNAYQYFYYHQRFDSIQMQARQIQWSQSQLKALVSRFGSPYEKSAILGKAAQQAHSMRDYIFNQRQQIDYVAREARVYEAEKWKKWTQSVACLIMFLIGAPLGAIIKKGGLGVPVLVGVVFFILYYIISNTGGKWSDEGTVLVPLGMWAANFVLFWAGLFFLDRARKDSRLLEADVYRVAWDRFSRKYLHKKAYTTPPAPALKEETKSIEA
jgi:lipopolysaccharide export system permease protein